MATLLSFTNPRPHGWSNEEKAQFARIRKLLGDAGVVAEIDLGMTDEGDPWCAVCSGITDDVIIHIARVDGMYLFDSAVLPTMIRGRSLNDCAQRFIDDATVLARRPQHGSTVFMHPSAMLAGVILTIFLYFESIGESSSHDRGFLALDTEEADTLDAARGDEDAPATGTDADAALASDEADSPLVALKLMLQQIAEAAQKHEGDRTGAHAASLGQNWGTALLSSGAVVAAIAYAQDSIVDLSDDGEPAALPSGVVAAAAGHGEASPNESGEDAGSGAGQAQGGTTVDAANAPGRVQPVAADVPPEDFVLMAQAATTAVADRADPAEATILMEALAEDRFVFLEGGPVEDAPEAQDAVVEGSVSAPQGVEDVSVLSSLVRFMSSSSIEIQDEVFDLGTFIGLVARDRPDTAPVDIVGPSPVLPSYAQSDVFVFPPSESHVEPYVEVATIRRVSDMITDFVKVTGLLSYDMTDRFNLAIYDSSIIGRETSEDVASRSFVLQDDSVVTFVGLVDELDMLFAA